MGTIFRKYNEPSVNSLQLLITGRTVEFKSTVESAFPTCPSFCRLYISSKQCRRDLGVDSGQQVANAVLVGSPAGGMDPAVVAEINRVTSLRLTQEKSGGLSSRQTRPLAAFVNSEGFVCSFVIQEI